MDKLSVVNTKIGTLNSNRYSNGNIYPICAMPFGMAHWTIQTDGNRGNWFYSPMDKSFEGIRLTHQPSPWVGDYGHVLFLPFSGKYYENSSYSAYRPSETIFQPHYINFYLYRYQIRGEFVPTERGGVMHILNASNEETGFLVSGFGEIEMEIEDQEICLRTNAQTYPRFKGLREYIYMRFSVRPNRIEKQADNRYIVCFTEKEVDIRMATSFISDEQAKVTFNYEINHKKFEDLKLDAEKAWNEKLELIDVSNENEARYKTFYSCLYRMFLYPRKFYEIDKTGKIYHYNADINKVFEGVYYNDNGFWDTYKTVYPLFNIIQPNLVREMIEGFVNHYEESGWLPNWISGGEIGGMPGTLIEAVIADAAVKGNITGDLLRRAYSALVKNAYVKGDTLQQGRRGIEDYLEYGYVTEKYPSAVNNTLDSCYGDFCIAQVARLVGDNKTREVLEKRSKNYKMLFDSRYGFMRAKDKNGHFKEEFDPYEWGGENCEGSFWQNSFSVYHDIEGLAVLYGGKGQLCRKLDELFAASPIFHVGTYHMEIHEMSEMAMANFGQCAISNQPSFHIPWLYALLGEEEKTEYWVEKIVDEAFSSNEDGFPGDEDNGSMAGWYVFACLGFYPVCPGKNEYAYSKPLFNSIKIKK